MNTAVQLRLPPSPPPQCELVHGTPSFLRSGARGPVAVFQAHQLVACIVTTSVRRRRLFLFRTIARPDRSATELPGVRPCVNLLLELRTLARIEKLRRLLGFLEKRGLEPSSMSDAFYIRVSHVLGGHLTAPKIVLSLLRHENRS